ncbi:OmpH family outer membrane protein [Thermophagus sp. OGC60D27]|uniref:OmpH family outer membrane protein n=1 Tax=Thermophagus sp. OGC60D27 TaxID=3458415 RepID=UPI0040379742
MKTYLIILLTAAYFALSAAGVSAQRYAFVDMQYIMSNIPAYEAAQEQLNQLSQKWEKEIQDLYADVEQLYKKYQKESVLLSPDMKTQREEEIIQLENSAKKLQRQYFGPEGELMKRQQALIQPIQEKVSGAIKEIADRDNLDAVFDMASNAGVVYVNPRQNISDEVLEILGYSK